MSAFSSLFPVILNIYFTEFSHIFQAAQVQAKSRARAGFSRQLSDSGRGRRAGLTADKRDRTKTEPSLGTLLVFYGLFCFSLFSYPLKGRPFDSFCFVLFCFSHRPRCQLGPEATMNIKYWAKQHLINVNNMHRENLSDEKSTYIFSGRQMECKWLWKI